ncbi:MAG: ATP-binding protein [Chloroflexota bacterium]
MTDQATDANITQMQKRFESQIASLTEQLAATKNQLEVEKAARQRIEDRYTLASQAGRTSVWDRDLVTGEFYLDDYLKRARGIAETQPLTEARWLETLHPDDRMRFVAKLQDVIRGQESSFKIEYRTLLHDGSVGWVEMHALVLRDQSGIPLRLLGTSTDVTQQKETEMALQAAKTELEVRIANQTAALEKANAALKEEIIQTQIAHEGLRRSEAILRQLHAITTDSSLTYGQKVNKLLGVGCQLLDLDTGILARVIDNQYEIIYVQSPMPMESGTILELRDTYCEFLLETSPEAWPFSFTAFADANQSLEHPAYLRFKLEAYIGLPIIVRGNVYGTLNFSSTTVRERPFTPTQKEAIKLMGQWISSELERQRLESEFRQSQKMEALGQLTSGVAHDFNNLLTIITGYSGLLTEPELGLPAGALRYAESIQEAGHQVSELTNQLLAFSRAQEQELQVLQLNNLVDKTRIMIERLIGENMIVSIDLDPTLGKVKLDPVQMNQVLVNLAVNARDAMPEGGQLIIQTEAIHIATNQPTIRDGLDAGEYALLSVRDTGIGMSQETISQIFEPFFTTKAKGKGTGLGLSTVNSIVSQIGGTIHVESEIGDGTVFRLYFPVADDDQNQPSTLSSEQKAPSLGTETILLVEDRASVREFVFEVLDDSGYNVLVAEDGLEAVTVFNDHQQSIRLLLTDVIMPGMNGAELAEFLREITPDLRVLYMSGYTDTVTLQGVNQSPHFLRKPFMPNDLLTAVRKAIDVN